MDRQLPTYRQTSYRDTKAYGSDHAEEVYDLQPLQDASENDNTAAFRLYQWCNVLKIISYPWKETVKDLRQIGRRRIVDVTYNHVLPVFIMVSLLVTVLFLALDPPVNKGLHLCRPDGASIIYVDGYTNWTKYNPWDTSETFTINIGFGNLPFGQAKLIDIIWDTVFGRGGQAMLASVSYYVFTSALSLSMERGSVTFSTFEAITLKQSSIRSISKIARDLHRNKGSQGRKLIPLVIICISLVLIFPILASAMTGYSANFDARFTVANDSTVAANSVQQLWYVVHDGSRLGQGFYNEYAITDLSSNGPVPGPDWFIEDFTFQSYENSRPKWMPGCSRFAPGKVNSDETISLSQSDTISPLECQLLWNMSRYTDTYGLFGLSDIASSFYNPFARDEIVLPSPALNVTMYMPEDFTYFPDKIATLFSNSDLAWSIIPSGVEWYPEDSYGDIIGHSSVVDRVAYQSGENGSVITTLYDIFQNLTCHQQSTGSDTVIKYQWGFAFQPLLAFNILLLVLITILYAIHVHVRLHSQLINQHRIVGLKRAVLDLAPLYQERLDHRQDGAMCTENNIKQLVSTGHISYEELISAHPVTTPSQRAAQRRKSFKLRTWLKNEWVCLTLISFVIAMIPCGLYTYTIYAFYPYFVPILFVGLVMVLVAGRKHFSRWLLFLPFLILFLGLQISLMTGYLFL